MVTKLKIGIDLDDVVFEFVKELINYYKEKTGNEILFENMNSYKFSEVIEMEHIQVEAMIKEMVENGKNLRMELCEFAKESILNLASKNELYFITSRVYRENTLESLEKYFSNINYELFFSSNPYVENEGKHKGEICLDLGIDYMIEDSPEHALNCANSGIKCFLIEKPWNENSEEHENIIRVKDWKEILERLEEIEQ
jgi:5'(3')-deoxyribonucleotidase